MSGNKYIVSFKPGVTSEQVKEYVAKVNNGGGNVGDNFEIGDFQGFSATIPDSLLNSLQLDSIIDTIEPDSIVTTQ